ncbi:response regulator [Sulfurospirillum arcachonense]|uniref:response regulator n=1 Tax=Sulfurospirillum arcachonense TaxID=57666 RepID=UPI00046890BE|nr:response regulator [Sulfurospirillum arcachonense]
MKDNIYNVLIVEDEFINAKFVEQILANLGHNVIAIVSNSNQALNEVKENKIDLVFMDINIDGPIDGIRCTSLLNQVYDIPVIYMSAYGDSNTLDEASNTNLYGYLVKPFDSHDVEACLRVALKMIANSKKISSTQIESTCIELKNNFTYNFQTKTLKKDTIYVELTKKETLILDLFCNNINQNISYELLLEKAWQGTIVTNSTIRDTMSRLRKKILPLNLENIAGVGYRLIND